MARRGAKAVKDHTVVSTFDNDKSVHTSTWVKDCRGPAIIPEGLS